jgi:hypothetical protein
MCFAFVCIASGRKNQIEIENSCGFIEPLPVKKYKTKADPAVDEACGLLGTVKHNLEKKAVTSQYLENIWLVGFEISITHDYSPCPASNNTILTQRLYYIMYKLIANRHHQQSISILNPPCIQFFL